MDILEITRRYFNKESIKSISKQTGFDRKTVRKYIKEVKEKGINNYDKEKIISVLPEISPHVTGRPNKSREKLTDFVDKVERHIEAGLKLKTIHEVLTERNELQISYSSFKRFVHENQLASEKKKSTCRLEKQPGQELQVDYAKMGLLYDPLLKKRKTVYAFIGTLSYSRHKFVDFVYSQNQQSFTQSHVKMFNFFDCSPKVIIIDNLKNGVIKPDIYDPQLNRSYAELAEHYGCFINPARVATPKDKPIVERDVQTIREQFKKLKAIDENLTINEANRKITDWIINKYGQTKHGTTKEKPYEEFVNIEKQELLSLPADSFEAALWKEALVHPDHYIQVNKKSYSIPHPYVGKKVWVKVTHSMVYVFYEEKLIKQHAIPKGYRKTDLKDFPVNMQYALNNGMPAYLIGHAKSISSEFGELIKKILSVHAFMNMRRAQGLIRSTEFYPYSIITEAAKIALDDYKRITPKLFSAILEDINTHNKQEEELPLSGETSSFIRSADYFIHTSNN